MMTVPDEVGRGPVLKEAARELEAAIHDARVAFDCIGLGELDRAHTSAVTARVAIDAAMIAIQAVLAQPAAAGWDDLGSSPDMMNPRIS
jgi:hypothetical protein